MKIKRKKKRGEGRKEEKRSHAFLKKDLKY
jgi:hypothetical protein